MLSKNKEQRLPLLFFLCSAGKVSLFDMQQFHDDGHETGPWTHSADAPRETGETVSLGPGKGDIVLVCDSE